VRAIVLSGYSKLSRNPGAAWGSLSPLVDRPFLQHVIESIVRLGIREIDLVLPMEGEAARTLLGDGTRWGATFHYHFRERNGRYRDVFEQIAAKNAERNEDELILLATSNRLPLLQDAQTSEPTVFCWQEDELHWTGWGVLRARDVARLPLGIEEKQLYSFLVRSCGCLIRDDGRRPLSANSYEDLIEANRRVLNQEFPALSVPGRQVQPGVWMARNVRVHATAKLKAPAFLGENARIGPMVQVGPSASIGRDCLIERETYVADSVVFGGSYVGEHLKLRGVVVDRSKLINPRWDVEIEGVDDLLLGSVIRAPWSIGLQRTCGRIVAAIALVLALPCLFVMLAASAMGLIPALRRELMVRTPAVSEPYRWGVFPLWSFGPRKGRPDRFYWVRDFFFCFLPALISIAAGYMGFAGSRPRSREEATRSVDPERCAFLRLRPGYLQVGMVQDYTLQDHKYYSQNAQEDVEIGWRGTMTLILNYGRIVLRSAFGRVAPVGQQGHLG
jgi:hypothetical protein